ncbi:hypothetical protein BGW38_002314 [Lunasporangiospora selenospora]|uniref:DASH complex subunit DAD1 n=1 Tax=Lunasporangiospora selenospora TaxID=979761 RepID=A0A9P6KJ23_9FUNG|nr:hypothetical protein BGW38_002314 [Lunasporangiospora selenospora]
MAVSQGAQGQLMEGSLFESERAKLVSDINSEMGQVITNISILNRNLDSIISIGHEFEQLAQLWKHFHTLQFQQHEDEPSHKTQDAE